VAPLEKGQPPMGVHNGDAMEGEDKSPSFVDILKKNPHPSLPSTRGRKSNKNCREKEDEPRIVEDS